MESTLTRSKETMKVKIPEIKKALEIIEFLGIKNGNLLSITLHYIISIIFNR